MIDSLILWAALLSCLAALGYAMFMIWKYRKGVLLYILTPGALLLALMGFAYGDSIFKWTHWVYAPQAYRPAVIGIFLLVLSLLVVIDVLIGIIAGNKK